MKLFVPSALLLMAVVQPAIGQSGGTIWCASDYPGISDCGLHESVGQVNSVWVVHGGSYPEGTFSRFMVVTDWDAPQLQTDYHGNFVVGDVYTGVEVSYSDYFNPAVPGCAPLPHLLAELRFMPMSPTAGCATVEVVPHPDAESGAIEVVDCFGTQRVATTAEPVMINGYQVIVDPTGTFCMCDIVKSRSTTWGAIKSLYQ